MTARKLGVLAHEIVVKDFIGENDPVDFYRFRLNKAGDLSIVLDGLDQDDAALSVLKGAPLIKEDELEYISSSDFDGNESEEVFRNALPKGDYLVKVDHISGNSDYTMRFRFGDLQFPDGAGSDVSNALNIGSLNQRRYSVVT